MNLAELGNRDKQKVGAKVGRNRNKDKNRDKGSASRCPCQVGVHTLCSS